jgi:threonine dehydrogenase-like Zn-dependent dehydrogenase
MDDVRVKIAYCGICGSDVHEYLGGPIFPPLPGQKNPHTGAELPVIMGHEMSGTIIQVGSNITRLKVGQNVAINPSMDIMERMIVPSASQGGETSAKAGRVTGSALTEEDLPMRL